MAPLMENWQQFKYSDPMSYNEYLNSMQHANVWNSSSTVSETPYKMYYFTDKTGTVHAFPNEEELNKFKAKQPKEKVILNAVKSEDPYEDDKRVFILVCDEKSHYVNKTHYIILTKVLKCNNNNVYNYKGIRLDSTKGGE